MYLFPQSIAAAYPSSEAGLNVRHVLLTRFNLATTGRERALRDDPAWLADRFDLFERYCLPSVASQTDDRFDWMIFFDEHTADWARGRIEQAQRIVPFHAVFTPMFGGDGWGRFTRLLVGPPVLERFIVTSNLDNDDGLAVDYVARIHAAVAASRFAPTPYAINFAQGVVLCGGARYLHRHLSNAFTNLVEADGPAIRTANTIRHMELKRHVPVIQDDGPPAWLQVVHGGNVSNRARGRLLRFLEPDRFPEAVLGPPAHIPLWRLVLENGILSPARTARDAAAQIYRRFRPAHRIAG